MQIKVLLIDFIQTVFKMKRLSYLSLVFKTILIIMALGLFNVSFGQAFDFNWDKIDPVLRADIENNSKDNPTYRIIVTMSEQYDQATMEQLTHFMSRQEKREFVVNEMKIFTGNSQAAVMEAISNGKSIINMTQFWIFNGFTCEAAAEDVAMLSNRSDVGMISNNNEIQMIPEEWNPVPSKAKGNAWNVTKVRADEVWTMNGDSGYTGNGIVVAVIDSGVNYNHTDIANNMWDGGTEYPNHGYDWVNGDNDPIDDHGHGSHCAGTVAGYGTNGTQTGMATGAKIMALKTLSAGGSGYNSNTLLAMQFALEHGADVLSMSLGTSGCGGFYYYRDTMITLMNAGVVASVAASNDGWRLGTFPIPYNIGAPGNCPPPFLHPDQKDILPGGTSATISIGATDQDDVHTWFTSVGPATWTAGSYIGDYNDYPYTEGSATEIGLIRPDVAAPGLDITSLDYSTNNGYCEMSGTSMATPCAAGVMALMLEANPMLLPRQIDSILEYTAVRCEGSTSKNNYTGSGRIDAYEAVRAALALNVVVVDEVVYDLDDDAMTAEVTGHIDGIDADGNLVVPANITYNGQGGEQVYTVTSIAAGAFTGCNHLQKLSIPKTVTTIGEAAFSGCSGLTFMSLLATTPPALGNAKSGDVFEGVDKNIPVVVPSGSAAAYQAAAGWSEFTNIQEITKHWTPISGNQYTMNINGIITIDGVEQASEFLEIGAFCGNECRESKLTIYKQNYNRFYVMLSIRSNVTSGEDITFRIYDHQIGEELELRCTNELEFEDGLVLGSFGNPYVIAFVDKITITTTANPAQGGVLSGAGQYEQNETVTVTARPNYRYVFENWTENGVVVSTDEVYSFQAEYDRDLVANFRYFSNHWIPIVGAQYNMTIDGIILIDDVEQATGALEIGAFCGDECRGSAIAEYFEPTNQYVVPLTIVSNQESGETITFFLYDHRTEQELDTLRCFNTVEFEDNLHLGTPGDWYEFLFYSQVEVTVEIVPEGSGTVDGAGFYFLWTMATLTAHANDGYAFHNWERDGVEVSSDIEYSFEVTEPTHLVLNFYKVETTPLVEGWNWWSTAIEMEGVDGLTMLENSLENIGEVIKSQNQFVMYNDDDDIWEGDLENIYNEQGYIIKVSSEGNAIMIGDLADPADHPITLVPQWTWIGYPVTVAQTPDVAMGDFVPTTNDIVKGQTSHASYYAGSGWWPHSFVMRPGQGYKYRSEAQENKTLTYVVGEQAKGIDLVEEKHYWDANYYAFNTNMNIIAMAYVEDAEQRDDKVEIGAFVNGECRGSAKLEYFEPLNRYYAMLTVAGADGEQVEFRIVNAENNTIGTECENNVTFKTDAVLGSLDNPYEMKFGEMNKIASGDLEIFPNPVESNQTFTVNVPQGETIAEIVITDVLGAVVSERKLSVAGTYIIKVSCESGKVYYGKLVVK